MRLTLIRHARPERKQTKDGSPADPPLDAGGHEQALRTARWLAGESIDALYASPLLRARQTAAPLAERLGIEPIAEARVAEYDRESDTYIPLEQLKAEDPEAWRAFARGGYGDGVDFAAFCREAIGALEEIIARHAGEHVAVVCHGGVINVFTAHVLGLEPRLFFEPDYASIHRYAAARSGERSIDCLNERPR